MDNFIIKNGICADYKEVNRFLSGCLSGCVIRRHEEIKKSQYMKVVLKAALRECIKNLITFNQIGTDNEFMCLNRGYRPHQITPFSH